MNATLHTAAVARAAVANGPRAAGEGRAECRRRNDVGRRKCFRIVQDVTRVIGEKL